MVDSCIGAGRERDFDVFCDLPEGFLEDLESLGITIEAKDEEKSDKDAKSKAEGKSKKK